MIYNRPRDIKLRTLPSLGSLVAKKETSPFAPPTEERAKADNLIITEKAASQIKKETATEGVPQNADFDIILKDRYIPEDSADGAIFDLTSMPLIEGIPILTLPDEDIPVSPQRSEEAPAIIFRDEKPEEEFTEIVSQEHTEDIIEENNKIIDISVIAVESDIPMLELTTKATSAPVSTPSAPPYARSEKEKKREEKKESRKTKKEKSFKKLSEKTINGGRRLKIASFFLMLYFGATVAFIIPLRPTYSESEKRELTPFPSFSIDAILSGDYFDDISTWFSDTFPYREQLTEANTYIKSFYGIETVTVHGDVSVGDDIPDAPIVVPDEPVHGEEKPDTSEPATQTPAPPDIPEETTPHDKAEVEVQQLGAIVVAGDSAYEYYGYSEEVAVGFVSCVNKLQALAKPTGNVYAMIIPTSMDITLDDDIRKQITSTADQKAAIDLFNRSFKNCVCVDGIYDTERLHRNEYIYFRTDHHWTALGAYYAYEQFALEKGIVPVPLSSYPVKNFNGFLGTFYSSSGKNPALKENPDTVTAYMPINDVDCTIMTHTGDAPMAWSVINDVTDYGSSLKYLTFIGGDNALTTITNNDNPDGGICVVIKDSYGNAFVPFLIPHYSTVYVIDPRYYTDSLSGFCADKEIEDVIFLTNISATRNYIYLEGLQNLAR